MAWIRFRRSGGAGLGACASADMMATRGWSFESATPRLVSFSVNVRAPRLRESLVRALLVICRPALWERSTSVWIAWGTGASGFVSIIESMRWTDRTFLWRILSRDTPCCRPMSVSETVLEETSSTMSRSRGGSWCRSWRQSCRNPWWSGIRALKCLPLGLCDVRRLPLLRLGGLALLARGSSRFVRWWGGVGQDESSGGGTDQSVVAG